MKRWRVLAVVVALAGCESISDLDLLAINATGLVMGVGYIDTNGSGEMDSGDAPAVMVEVALAFPESPTPASVIIGTDSTGVFEFLDVPAGEYQFTVIPTALGDSLEIVELTPENFTVTAGDTVAIVLGLRVLPPAPGLPALLHVPEGLLR